MTETTEHYPQSNSTGYSLSDFEKTLTDRFGALPHVGVKITFVSLHLKCRSRSVAPGQATTRQKLEKVAMMMAESMCKLSSSSSSRHQIDRLITDLKSGTIVCCFYMLFLIH